MKKEFWKSKNIGIGSISLPITIIGIVFSFSQINGTTLGTLLNTGIPSLIISLILFFIAIFIGKKYINNLFTKTSIILSIICSLLIITASILTYVSSY